MKSNEELFKELQAKLDKEYEDLTNEVIKLEPRDIINRSYEFVIKEEIKDLYFDNKDLERYDIKALLSLDNTLDYLYNSWICTDFQINNEIRDALEDEVMELSKVFINKNLEKCKNKDKYIKWLKKNAGERMDANRKELFKPDRCNFHLDRYEFASKYIKDGNKVLDVASGTGYGAFNMRKNNPAIDIIGVEIDEMAV